MDGVLCVGVDPAPSGRSARGNAMASIHSSNGKLKIESKPLSHPALRQRLRDWAGEPSVLLAWDAPLTGPSAPLCVKAGGPGAETRCDFTQRDIERAFTKAWKPPKGISVQGYSGCSHWALTRNLLGLPVVGPYDTCHPVFKLLTERPEVSWNGHYVVEVHPALALWLWLRGNHADWDYKKSIEVRRGMAIQLARKWSDLGVQLNEADLEKIVVTSDALDAAVAAVLAFSWVVSDSGVQLLGDRAKGAMLLPTLSGLPHL